MAGENLHLSMLLTAQTEQARGELAAVAQAARNLAKTGPEVSGAMAPAKAAIDGATRAAQGLRDVAPAVARAFAPAKSELSDTATAANTLQTAVNGLNRDLRLQSAELVATARETAQYRGELEALRAQFNPIFAASKAYEQQLRDIAEAEQLGAISAQEAAAARQRATTGIAPMTAGLTGLGRVTSVNAMHSANLAAQFNDIGVMALAMQNPLQLALQQGTQINQVFGMMGGHRVAIRAIGPALLSIVSPASLATIGIIALGTAAVQWLLSLRDEAFAAEDALQELNESLNDLRETTRLATKAGLEDLERRYGRVTAQVQRLAEVEERAARRRLQNQLETFQERQAQEAGAPVIDEFGGSDVSGAIVDMRRNLGFLREDAAGAYAELSRINAISTPSELADVYADLIASMERAEAANGGLTESQRSFLQELIDSEALARQLVAIEETRGQLDARRADQMLTDLQSELAIRAAINVHGEESTRVTELRIDAERRAFEEELRTLDVTEETKAALREAWEAANGLAAVNMSAGISAARDRARELADELGRAEEASRSLAQQGAAELADARIRLRYSDPIEQARHLAEARMQRTQGPLRSEASGAELAALDAEVLAAGNAAAETARLNEERTALNRTRRDGTRASGQEREAVEELITNLQTEIDILRETDPVQQEMIRQRGVLAAATAEERAQVEDLIRARNEENAVQEANQRALEGMRDLGRDVLRGMIDDLRNGASAGDILANALDRVLDRIIEIGMNNLLDMLFPQGGGGGGGFLAQLFGSFFSPILNAKGDVVGAPTLFAYGDQPGKLGVMGEAGPEAIMPLTHGMGAGVGALIGGRETTLPLARLASGKLGVALPEDMGARAFASGGAFGYVPPPPAFAQGLAQSGASVVQLQPVLVNNTSIPMQMETEESTDARGQRQQKYILSEAVGEGLATTGGRGGRTLKQVYGVSRSARRRQA